MYRNLKSKTLIVAASFIFCSANLLSELIKYEDSSGKVYYVDSLEKVPLQYRESIKTEKSFPKVSSISPGKYVTPKTNKKNLKSCYKKPEVFLTDFCPHCRELEVELKERKIRYKRINIDKDSKGKKTYKAIGGKGVPLTRVCDKIISGNNINGILKALGK